MNSDWCARVTLYNLADPGLLLFSSLVSAML
jgi:hypothetical protein